MNPKKTVSLLLFLMISLVLLSACNAEATAPFPTETAVAQVFQEATATEEMISQPTQTTAPPEPTEAPTLRPIVEAAPVSESDACVDCHADQDRLIDTASPVAVVPENEGEG